jgi:hypothetical protein
MRPTIADAVARATVALTHRGWTGTLIFVEQARARAKVRLNSGTVVWVPLDQLEVRATAPQAHEAEVAHAHGAAQHHRQAG